MSFLTLALICFVALSGPAMSLQHLARVPVVIGELLVGLVLGASGLKVLSAGDPTFSFLAEIGFALVMLIAGSHVPVRDPALRSGLPTGLARAGAIGLLSVPVGLGIAAVFGTGHGALYAVLLASSSAALAMPTLDGLPLTAPDISAMLPQLAVADAACIVALPLAIDPAHAASAALGAAVVLAAGVVVFLLLRWTERRGWRKAVHNVSEERGLAIELRFSLVLLFGLAALALTLHISVMLAGFALGLALAGIGEPRRLSKQLFALSEGFFAPIFFVWLGSSLDVRQLGDHPQAIALGLVLGLAAAGVHAAMAATGQPWPVAVLTCAQLGVPVAATTLGTRLRVLRPGEDTALILSALVTVVAVTMVSGKVAGVARQTPSSTR